MRFVILEFKYLGIRLERLLLQFIYDIKLHNVHIEDYTILYTVLF